MAHENLDHARGLGTGACVDRRGVGDSVALGIGGERGEQRRRGLVHQVKVIHSDRNGPAVGHAQKPTTEGGLQRPPLARGVAEVHQVQRAIRLRRLKQLRASLFAADDSRRVLRVGIV